MAENDKTGANNAASHLIFACSGGSDVGEIADRSARTLARTGAGRMYCLAGIGGRVPGVMSTTKAAASILAIDACPNTCVKHALELAGFTTFAHLNLSELGFKKGQTAVSEEHIAVVVQAGAALLADAQKTE